MKRDGTAESVTQGQMVRRERGQRKKHFHSLAGDGQDWQLYRFNPHSAERADNAYINTTYIQYIHIYICTYIRTYIHTYMSRLIRGFRNEYH